MLAMVGIPLGASSRKGGRSAGYIWAIFLAFFCYYLAYITLTSLARSHSMSVELASWLPNAGFATGRDRHDRAHGNAGRPRLDRQRSRHLITGWVSRALGQT